MVDILHEQKEAVKNLRARSEHFALENDNLRTIAGVSIDIFKSDLQRTNVPKHDRPLPNLSIANTNLAHINDFVTNSQDYSLATYWGGRSDYKDKDGIIFGDTFTIQVVPSATNFEINIALSKSEPDISANPEEIVLGTFFSVEIYSSDRSIIGNETSFDPGVGVRIILDTDGNYTVSGMATHGDTKFYTNPVGELEDLELVNSLISTVDSLDVL